MREENFLIEMESLFLALSDKTRLRLLNLMREREVCVNYFTEVLGESQPKISRHLASLRNANIVSARRDGKWIHYKIKTPQNSSAANILKNALSWLETQDAMREDCRKLARFYSSNDFAETVSGETGGDVYAEKDMRSNAREELATFLL